MANGDIRNFPTEARVQFSEKTGKLTIVVDDQLRVFSDSAWTELIYPEESDRDQLGGFFMSI